MAFDHRVQTVNPKTGQVINHPEKDHVVHISGGETHSVKIERPIGSGIFYAPDGSLLEDKSKRTAVAVEGKK